MLATPDPLSRRSRAIATIAVLTMATLAALSASPAVADSKNVPLQDPDRAFLGIRMHADSGTGVHVAGVLPGSAAEAAGVAAGDVIVGIGQGGIQSPEQLKNRLAHLAPGDRVDVTVLRDGVEQRIGLELGEIRGKMRIDLDGLFTLVSPKKRGTVKGTIHFNSTKELQDMYLCQADNCRFSGRERIWYRADCIGRGCPSFEIDFYKTPVLGVHVSSDRQELRELLGADGQGVIVTEVFVGSPAEEAGLEAGDVIVSVDEDAVASVRDLRRILKSTDGGAMELDIIREGEAQRLRLYMTSRNR